jgi:hypothetical protein
MDIPSDEVTKISSILFRCEALAATAAIEVCNGDTEGHAVSLTDMLREQIARLRAIVEPYA